MSLLLPVENALITELDYDSFLFHIQKEEEEGETLFLNIRHGGSLKISNDRLTIKYLAKNSRSSDIAVYIYIYI